MNALWTYDLGYAFFLSDRREVTLRKQGVM